MVTGRYRIGEKQIFIKAPEDLPHPDNVVLFRQSCEESAKDTKETKKTDSVEKKEHMHMAHKTEHAKKTDTVDNIEKVDYTYTIHLIEHVEQLYSTMLQKKTGRIFEREDLTIIETKTGECRMMKFRGTDWHYALSHETSEQSCHIWFSTRARSYLTLDTAFWSAFCLERLLLRENSLVLHCAYMEHDGQAILFSGQSGIGKSTQADLWARYRGTKTLNGDRALLIRKGGVWHAYGFPICGSSKICINKSLPIKAIVILRQAKKNKVTKIGGLEAVKEVMSQLMINNWNRLVLLQSMDLLDDFLKKVPACTLQCDISEQAVSCLEEYLQSI